MKKLIGLVLCLLLITLCTFALADVAIDETNFPDKIFRNLVSNNFDKDKNDILNEAEISEATTISIDEEAGVASLKGIEYFTELRILYCGKNQLTSLDLSNNTKLYWLSCYQNKISSLNLSNNRDLYVLLCSANQLTSLDVSGLTALVTLRCTTNKLTALNVDGCTALKEISCYDNQLEILDISTCPILNNIVRTEDRCTLIDPLYPVFDYWPINEDDEIITLEVDRTTTVIAGDYTSNPTIKPDSILVSSITLNKTKATLTRTSDNKKPTLQLTATVEPEDADDPSVEWSSSNPKVAKVNQNGKVTALKKGTAVITCAAKDGSGVTATCKITVKDKLISKLTLNKKKVTIKKGKTFQLKVKAIKPADAFNQKVTWKSSNTKIATVDKNGKVKAKKKGTCIITCTAKDGSGKKVTCKVTVK